MVVLGYDGIDERVVSLKALLNKTAIGNLMKVSAGIASAAEDGEEFIGICRTLVESKPLVAGVQLAGIITVPYTGAIPEYGYSGLVSNGEGGVRYTLTGKKLRYVIGVNTTDKTVTFIL